MGTFSWESLFWNFPSRKPKLVFCVLRVFNEIFLADKSASDWFHLRTYKEVLLENDLDFMFFSREIAINFTRNSSRTLNKAYSILR
jgi:hypothetical protein